MRALDADGFKLSTSGYCKQKTARFSEKKSDLTLEMKKFPAFEFFDKKGLDLTAKMDILCRSNRRHQAARTVAANVRLTSYGYGAYNTPASRRGSKFARFLRVNPGATTPLSRTLGIGAFCAGFNECLVTGK